MTWMIWDTPHWIGNLQMIWPEKKQTSLFGMAETIAQLRTWSNRCSLDLAPSGTSFQALVDDCPINVVDLPIQNGEFPGWYVPN